MRNLLLFDVVYVSARGRVSVCNTKGKLIVSMPVIVLVVETSKQAGHLQLYDGSLHPYRWLLAARD
jgi:hypothetical protein